MSGSYLEHPAMSRAEVIGELVELGYQPVDAAQMLREYYDETSARVGVRTDLWSLDTSDVDAIASTYEWVDREHGESLAAARERATATAQELQKQATGAEDATAREEAARWAERSRPPGENVLAAKTAARATAAGEQSRNTGQEVGAVAGSAAGPDRDRGTSVGYEQFDQTEFVNRIAGLTHDRAAAERIAREYVEANTARHGVPEGGWRFDEYDVADVERRAMAAAVSPDDLARAVARVVEDYRAETDPEATFDEAIAQVRADLDADDIDVLAADGGDGGPWMDAGLAAAYRQVLAAEEEAFTPAVTAQAEAVAVDERPREESAEGGGSGPSWESIRAEAQAAGVEQIEERPTLVLVDAQQAVDQAVADVEHDLTHTTDQQDTTHDGQADVVEAGVADGAGWER